MSEQQTKEDQLWRPIESAPRDGSKVEGRRSYINPITYRMQYRIRKTWFGKASHVPLYGWCFMKKPRDVENVELWEPTDWRRL